MSFWYLATPYNKYPYGMDAAFHLACENAALLIRHRVHVFSPIAHSHPIAMAGGLDPVDYEIWMEQDEKMVAAAKGIILLKAVSWEISVGMAKECALFIISGKTVISMLPGVVPVEFTTPG